MTVEQAVTWLRSLWIGYKNQDGTWQKKIPQEWNAKACQIAALLESQQQTIEALKCCGNCRNWYLLAESSEVIKYCNLKHGENYTFRTDKCDKWEGVSRDD